MFSFSKRVLAVFFAFVLFTAPAFAGTYSNSNLGIAFETPSDWNIADQMGGEYVFGGPLDPAKSATRISISADPFASLSDLSQAAGYFRQHTLPEAQVNVLSESDGSIAGVPAKVLVYTDVFQGKAAKHVEYHTLRSGRLVVFRYISSPETFDANWAEAKVIFDTMRFTS